MFTTVLIVIIVIVVRVTNSCASSHSLPTWSLEKQLLNAAALPSMEEESEEDDESESEDDCEGIDGNIDRSGGEFAYVQTRI